MREIISECTFSVSQYQDVKCAQNHNNVGEEST